MVFLGMKVKLHNEREKHLMNIIINKIERCREYIENNTFGDSTRSIVRRNLIECDNLFLALYYMDLVPVTTIRPDLEKEFNIDLY